MKREFSTTIIYFLWIACFMSFSCSDEVVPPSPGNRLANIQVWIQGKLHQEPLIRDTLILTPGSRFAFTARFSANSASPPGPLISFDGSGFGYYSPVVVNQQIDVVYEPKISGTHPIWLYWNNDPCAFIPKDRTTIMLFVQSPPSVLKD
jgi:hypothetical protein